MSNRQHVYVVEEPSTGQIFSYAAKLLGLVALIGAALIALWAYDMNSVNPDRLTWNEAAARSASGVPERSQGQTTEERIAELDRHLAKEREYYSSVKRIDVPGQGPNLSSK